MISVNGSQFQGSSDFIKPEKGTYPCKLVSASMYKNENFDKDKLLTQITLEWDTGLVGENSNGDEVDVVIFDSWLTFSLNEKANLTKRFKALMDFDERTADLQVEFADNISSEDDLKHWRDGRAKVMDIRINDKSLFGLEALVEVGENSAGYTKVVNVSKPLVAGAKLKSKNLPAGAPA